MLEKLIVVRNGMIGNVKAFEYARKCLTTEKIEAPLRMIASQEEHAQVFAQNLAKSLPVQSLQYDDLLRTDAHGTKNKSQLLDLAGIEQLVDGHANDVKTLLLVAHREIVKAFPPHFQSWKFRKNVAEADHDEGCGVIIHLVDHTSYRF